MEMQLFNKYDNEKRTLYYWSKQYAGQVEEGQSYKRLRKCVTINILNFSILPNDRYHSVFHLREIHIMELSKLSSQNIPNEGGLLNWLLFLKSEDTTNWEVLKVNEPALGKAMTALEYLSQDAEARRLYEMRQKALHDEASMLEGAKEEGKIELARNLLHMGVDLNTLAKATGLPVEELNKLKH